jgi:hypothetical protein
MAYLPLNTEAIHKVTEAAPKKIVLHAIAATAFAWRFIMTLEHAFNTHTTVTIPTAEACAIETCNRSWKTSATPAMANIDPNILILDVASVFVTIAIIAAINGPVADRTAASPPEICSSAE